MLRLIGIVVSIALADSLNPSTVAPALYLAGQEHARVRVGKFALGVFAVSFLGGVIIVLGPGQLILSLAPHPRPSVGYWLEIVAGVVLVVGGSLLWRFRLMLAEREMREVARAERSALPLGAGIMAVELPTAFPYFGALAAIIGSGHDIPNQLLLVVLYNVVFTFPLLAILGVLWRAGDEATRVLGRIRAWGRTRWPVILAVVLLLTGAFVVTLGVTGLVSELNGRLARLSRHLRHLILLHHLFS